jgi:hypothetical protein
MAIFSGFFAFVAGTPAIVGMILAALVIFLTSDWRLSLTALLAQYLLVGLALTRSVRLEVALVKILVGAIAVAILYLSAQRFPRPEDDRGIQESGPRFLGMHVAWLGEPLGLPLRLLSLLFVVLALLRLFESYPLTVVPMEVALVGCWLGGLGMLGLVLSGNPLRSAAAVLTILAGFDLVYARLEPSLAVVGFFCVLTLLASLAFSYLASARNQHQGQDRAEEPGS